MRLFLVCALALSFLVSSPSQAGVIIDYESGSYIRIDNQEGNLRFFSCKRGQPDGIQIGTGEYQLSDFKKIVSDGIVPWWGIKPASDLASRAWQGFLGCTSVALCAAGVIALANDNLAGTIAAGLGLYATMTSLNTESNFRLHRRQREFDHLVKWFPVSTAIVDTVSRGYDFPTAELEVMRTQLRSLLMALDMERSCQSVLKPSSGSRLANPN